MVKFADILNSQESPQVGGIFLPNFRKHILTAAQFTQREIGYLLYQARRFEALNKPNVTSDKLAGRIAATLFYEPSTRTRFSFETAAQNLGAAVITSENTNISSSATKGESLEDTIRIVQNYSDAIVIRHPQIGAAAAAAQVASVPIINAGDGAGSHPTQALLDLYTIQKELRKLTGLKIAVVGDLLYGRAARSFCEILTKFSGNKLFLVSPPPLKLNRETKKFLTNQGLEVFEFNSLEAIISKVDVLYMSRIQKERFADKSAYSKLKGSYKLTKALVTKMKKHSIIMHPLPRVDEIDPEVDTDRRAVYFRQAANGVAIRMAVLDSVLG